VVKDSVDVVKDERLAEFVVKSHRDTHPEAQDGAAAETNAKAEQVTHPNPNPNPNRNPNAKAEQATAIDQT
jgi:DNA replicative helicase MCM subunit Mcm2 (Cdc46/Mcm family)